MAIHFSLSVNPIIYVELLLKLTFRELSEKSKFLYIKCMFFTNEVKLIFESPYLHLTDCLQYN